VIETTQTDTLVELSGGMESTALLRAAKREVIGRVGAVFFDVGQLSANRQFAFAKRACNELAVPLEYIDIPNLRNAYLDILEPPYAFVAEGGGEPLVMGTCSVTLMATIFGATHGYKRVLYGGTKSDLERVPELRDLLDAIQNLVRLNTRSDVELVAPFIDMEDADVLRAALNEGYDVASTWSCIWGYREHCGTCERCEKRRRVYKQAGVADPTIYVDHAVPAG
jgi:7-cyano-7-deazaguanine synthase